MGRTGKFILAISLLLFAAAFISAQVSQKPFPTVDNPNTWTALNNFTGGLQVSGSSVAAVPINLATQVTGTLPAADLPATTSQCTGVQFSRGQALGGTENCATPPTFVASGASHAVGYVPDPGAAAGTTHFLREDATWATVPAGTTVTAVDLTTQGANITATALVTPGANGYYRFSCYIVETRAATTSSTLPTCNVGWTDADTSTALSQALTITDTSNTVGTTGILNTNIRPFGVYAKSGVAVTYSTSSYATSGATSMQYAVHIRLEGPF